MTDGSETGGARGALDGLVVCDLSRILAGPTATQLLGDLGATVVKIENPGSGGDDTRAWGPPYAETHDGQSDLSAYFMAANRNKLSVAADLATEEGAALVRAIAAEADVVIENFKPGGLVKYGLDHETLRAAHPRLVYCSISGFGQTGPNRELPGYDLMAQGYGGIMSLTGPANGAPHKVGVGIADVMCGMYACVGILAALRHRDSTGEGQHIDLSLVDAQMAWLINEGTNYLASGRDPERRGNAHPNIAPYDVYPCADGHVILAVGNDGQFRRFAAAMGRPELGQDPRFMTNPLRLENRVALTEIVTELMAAMPRCDILGRLAEVKVPAGPIHTVAEALGSEQARARGAVISVPHPDTLRGEVQLLGNPLKFSATPVTVRRPPPRVGQDGSGILDRLRALRTTPSGRS
ncbi:CaiB/BaiF CoA transferase family protein [Roseivivax isoporae]|uniref:CoA transferase n=1 Tax=Roseivivax isoporae LMG 25204 TaxID=1449351 RepID=X7FA64_9RHOB|nr:CoA transferase [Roseivivax isoporae]ETX29807.1 CoA transferase [Roseivivax isoporae LMG 25204]